MTHNTDTITRLADKLMRWPLPESLCSDGCVTKCGAGRSGTNLLSVSDARELLRFLLDDASEAAEPVARDWELTCDECAGTGKVNVSEALHVDGRYMGEDLTRVSCDACAGYGFTICVADIPSEIRDSDRAPGQAGRDAVEARSQQFAERVRDGIADFAADNWPDRKHSLAEIENGIRAIEVNAGLIRAALSPPAGRAGE